MERDDGTEWVLWVDRRPVLGLWTVEGGPKPEAKLRILRWTAIGQQCPSEQGGVGVGGWDRQAPSLCWAGREPMAETF